MTHFSSTYSKDNFTTKSAARLAESEQLFLVKVAPALRTAQVLVSPDGTVKHVQPLQASTASLTLIVLVFGTLERPLHTRTVV